MKTKAKTNAKTTGRPVTIWFASRHAIRRLDQTARAEGLSRSDFVRLAVEEKAHAEQVDVERVTVLEAQVAALEAEIRKRS